MAADVALLETAREGSQDVAVVDRQSPPETSPEATAPSNPNERLRSGYGWAAFGSFVLSAGCLLNPMHRNGDALLTIPHENALGVAAAVVAVITAGYSKSLREGS